MAWETGKKGTASTTGGTRWTVAGRHGDLATPGPDAPRPERAQGRDQRDPLAPHGPDARCRRGLYRDCAQGRKTEEGPLDPRSAHQPPEPSVTSSSEAPTAEAAAPSSSRGVKLSLSVGQGGLPTAVPDSTGGAPLPTDPLFVRRLKGDYGPFN